MGQDPGFPGSARSMVRVDEEEAEDHGEYVEQTTAFQKLVSPAHQRPPRSRSTSRAQLWPGAPVTPPPGCAPEPQRYSPGTGVR